MDDVGSDNEYHDGHQEPTNNEMSKIQHIVESKIIPQLYLVLSKQDEDSLVVRTPVALAITELLRKMPKDVLLVNLPKLVLTMCNILKSRQQSARDAAREILVKILAVLGPEYFPLLVRNLKGVLTKGYQLHVLGYVIHSLLVDFVPSIVSPSKELDQCLPMLVEIFVADIFGQVGAERDAQELNGKMREIKKTMSFDSLELVSKSISMSSTMTLLNPLKEVMLETENPSVTQKLDLILKRIANGLNANNSVNIKDLMVFIYDLVTENLTLSKMSTDANASNTMRDLSLARNFTVQMKRPSHLKPLKHFQANAHRFVEFGYSLLLTAAKRGTLDINNSEHISMISPMINVFGKSLFAKHTSVIVLVTKILAIVVKISLDTLTAALPVMVKRLFELVSRSADTGSDLVQSTFRLLSTIIRTRPDIEIREHQLITVLEMIKPDLEVPDRQNISFSLVRAILSRKYIVEIVYDVMDQVAKILVSSQSSQVRALSRAAYLQFLLEYPQGKQRLQKQWNHIIKNLQYEFESGRESVMELLHSILEKFPESIILEYSEVLFLSLVVNLVNDDSSRCRNMTGTSLSSHYISGILIKSLLSKNGVDRTDNLLVLVNSWFERLNQPEMIRTSAQVYGLLFESFSDSVLSRGGTVAKRWISLFMPNLLASLDLVVEEMKEAAGQQGDDPDDSATLFRYWDAGYYCLTSLGKLMANYASFALLDDECHTRVRNLLTELLIHPHQWIRSASSRVFGIIFSHLDNQTLRPTSASGTTIYAKLILQQEGALYNIAIQSALQLQGRHISQESCIQIVKNLLFISKCMHSNSICDSIVKDNEDNEASELAFSCRSSSLARLIKKLAYFCRSAPRNSSSTHSENRIILVCV